VTYLAAATQVTYQDVTVSNTQFSGYSKTAAAVVPSSKPTLAPGQTSAPTASQYAVVPVLQSVSVTAASTNATISSTFILESTHYAGTVYCAVQSSKVAAPTSVSQVVLNSKASAAFSSSATGFAVAVKGLAPVTSYSVYCAVVNVYGYTSSLTSVTSTSATATTTCCNKISFGSVPSFVQPTLSTTNAFVAYLFSFTMTVGALPSSGVSIVPKLSNALGRTLASSSVSISPAFVNLTSTSVAVSFTFFVKVSNATLLNVFLGASLTGPSRNDYSVTADSSAIQLLLSTAPLPAPVFSAASFLSSGSAAVFTFSSATDYAGITSTASWSCDKLFSFDSASTSKCIWTNSSAVTMTLPTTAALVAYNAYVVPYASKVTLLGSKLRAACGGRANCTANVVTAQTTLTFGVLGDAMSPTVVLQGATKVTNCEAFVIDASSSYGSGGRQWKRVSWSIVDQVNDYAEASVIQTAAYGRANISALLNSSSVYDEIVIPAQYLYPTTLTFSLTLVNYLGGSSTKTLNVEVLSYGQGISVPIQLAIVGSSQIATTVSDAAVLMANVSFPSCVDSRTKLSYVWSVSDLGTDETVDSTPGLSPNPLQFNLLPYMLEYLHTYSVTVTVSSETTSTSAASSTVAVAESIVQAIVEGGYQRSAPVDLPLALDGSSSRDFNVRPNATQNLLYSWSCRISTLSTEYGNDCGVFTDPSVGSDGSTSVSTAVVTIAANAMAVNESYLFTLTVSDSSGARYDSVDVAVMGIEAGSVVMVMGTQVTSPFAYYVSLGGTKLTLSSTIYGTSDVQATWSATFSGSAVQLSGLLTQQDRSFSSDEVGSDDGMLFPLVVAASVLTGNRLYTFTQTACLVAATSRCSSASVNVFIADAPTSGFLAASPSVGIELTTNFLLSSNGWVDTTDGYPIQYSFFYQTAPTSPSLQTRSPSYKLSTYTTLPAGLNLYANRVTLYGVVTNAFSATTNASAIVTVNATSTGLSLANITSLLNLTLAQFTLTESADVLTSTINAVAVSAVTTNCTNAPNCSALNRSPCDSVANTCSFCTSGYSGIYGPSNTFCFLPNASSDGYGLAVGEQCDTDSNCLFGYCDQALGTCQYPSKTCPSSDPSLSCSGHGTCVFVDGAGEEIDECLISNTLCKSKCACTDGYSESDCSASTDDAASLQTLRTGLCSAINATMRKQAESSALMDSIVGSLLQSYSISSVYDGVAQSACSDVLQFLVNLADDGYLGGVQTSTLQFMTQFLSSFVVSPPPDPSSNDVMLSAVDSVVNGILGGVVSGESATEIVSDNVRISVQVPLLSDLRSNGTLSAPLSDADKYYGSVAPAISLSADGLDSCGNAFSNSFAKLSIAQFNSNPYANSSTTKTSILRYSAVASSGAATDSVSSSADSYFYLTFPFSSLQAFALNVSTAGANSTFPECSQTTGSSSTAVQTACTGCNVSSYTESNVTVLCRDTAVLCPGSGVRRRLNNVGDETVESVKSYGVLAQAAGQSFVKTLSYNPFAHLGRAKAVLIFLSILLFFLVLGVVVFIKVDTFEHNFAVYAQAESRREKLLKEHKETQMGISVRRTDKEKFQEFSSLMTNVFGVGYEPQVLTSKSEEKLDTAVVVEEIGNGDRDTDDSTDAGANDVHRSNFKQIMASNPKIRQGLIKEFMYSVIPANLMPHHSQPNASLLERFSIFRHLETILTYHEYTSFMGPPGMVSRCLRWLSLCRGVLLALFIDTLFYDIMYPDSGECSVYTDEASCLAKPSQVEAGKNLCSWIVDTVQDSSSQQSVYSHCQINQPPGSSIYVIMSSCLILMIALPIDMALGSIIDEYGRCRPDLSVLRNTLLGFCCNWSSDSWLGSTPGAIPPTSLVSEFGVSNDNDEQENLAGTDAETGNGTDDIVPLASVSNAVGELSHEEKVEREFRFIRTVKRILKRYSPREWESRRLKKTLQRESPEEFELRHLTYSDLVTRQRTGFDDEYMLKQYRANLVYDSLQPSGDEVQLMLARIKKYFLEDLENLSLTKDPLASDERRDAKILAIMEQLRVYPSGEMMPLSMLQRLRYGDSRARLEQLIEKRGGKVAEIAGQLEELDSQGLNDCMDVTLLQHFVLEQLPLHKQWALAHVFFNYQRMSPPEIGAFLWILVWTFTICVYAFLFYWMFTWGVRNGGSTLQAWGINFALGFLQDVFALKVAKVLVQFVFVFETARPQLKMIFRVFTHVATMIGTGADRVQQLKLQTSFSVVQYLSAACRVANSYVAKDLVGGALLRLVDDIDVANCRLDRNRTMGLVQFSLSGPLGTVYLFQEFLSDQLYELTLPLAFAAFLIANAVLFSAGAIYISIPYIILSGLLIYLYFFLRPARQRRNYIKRKRLMRAHAHNKAMKGAMRGNSYGVSKRFRQVKHKTTIEWFTSRMQRPIDCIARYMVIVSDPFFQSWQPHQGLVGAHGSDPSANASGPLATWLNFWDWYNRTPAGVRPYKRSVLWMNVNMPSVRQAYALHTDAELAENSQMPMLVRMMSAQSSNLLSADVRRRLQQNRLSSSIPVEVRMMLGNGQESEGGNWAGVLGELSPRELESHVAKKAAPSRFEDDAPGSASPSSSPRNLKSFSNDPEDAPELQAVSSSASTASVIRDRETFTPRTHVKEGSNYRHVRNAFKDEAPIFHKDEALARILMPGSKLNRLLGALSACCARHGYVSTHIHSSSELNLASLSPHHPGQLSARSASASADSWDMSEVAVGLIGPCDDEFKAIVAAHREDEYMLSSLLIDKAKAMLEIYCPKNGDYLPDEYVVEIVKDLKAFVKSVQLEIPTDSPRLPQATSIALRAKMRDEKVLAHYQATYRGFTRKELVAMVWRIKSHFDFTMELILDATVKSKGPQDEDKIVAYCQRMQGNHSNVIVEVDEIPHHHPTCKVVPVADFVAWFYLKTEAVDRLYDYFGEDFFKFV
jgi:hypothetical protein